PATASTGGPAPALPAAPTEGVGTPLSQKPAARPAPKPAAKPAGSKLSVAQMLSVMRVEFHRARAQRYPLCCLMVAIDGLAALRSKHGNAAKETAMRAAYDLLKDIARERTFIGMALMSGDRIMAVFPNLAPSKLSEFASQYNARAKRLPHVVEG